MAKANSTPVNAEETENEDQEAEESTADPRSKGGKNAYKPNIPQAVVVCNLTRVQLRDSVMIGTVSGESFLSGEKFKLRLLSSGFIQVVDKERPGVVELIPRENCKSITPDNNYKV